MNTPTPTPRPALKATGMRRRHARCLETELAALTTEREVIQNANAHHAERRDAIARAESAEREAFDWKKIARYEAARAERAEAELATEREKSERYRLATLRLDAELSAERARLDWLESNAGDIPKYNSRSFIWFANQNLRAAIDAAMKEDAK